MKRTRFKSLSPWNTNNTRYEKKIDRLLSLFEYVGFPKHWRLYPYVTDRVHEFFSETPYGAEDSFSAGSYRECIFAAFDQ